MALFDPKKIERVAESVRESDYQEEIKNRKENIETGRKETTFELSKKKVGRPMKNPEERKRSSPVSMTEKTIERIELYKNDNFPSISRSAVIVDLLEEILEMKGY